ncbi:hypothetical protein PAHAL_4G028400 [Panicum hallii]|uniref:Uncharacterized protein n=1 Tax=Panicum hallii TaxID=206008 RepID=A0A2T8JBI0_9POAL|nr:hypothetical protein PAHAL_4G028400 [Panicum hallii]
MRDVLFVLLCFAFASSSSSDSSWFWFHLMVDPRRVAAMTKNMVRSSERRVLPRLAELKSSPSPTPPPLDPLLLFLVLSTLLVSFSSFNPHIMFWFLMDEKGCCHDDFFNLESRSLLDESGK